MSVKAGVIVTAAGMSSRMKKLKLLLPLEDKTIIEHVVDNASVRNVEEIVVVLGREKERVEAVLRDRNVKFAENPDFAKTDMLQSIKCGVAALSDDIDCFFIVPGDMPLITKACYQCMLTKYECHKDNKIVKIRYNGCGGHPILIDSSLKEEILNYEGDGGLKGVLKPYENQTERLEWPSEIVIADADTPEDYENIKRIYESKGIPGRAAIFMMLEMNKTPREVIRHSLMVEKVALILTEQARIKGYKINSNIVSAAALLHDIEREKPKHAQRGAELLERLGYKEIGDIIREHMLLSEEAGKKLDERAIVYLADKMVQGNQIVDFEERFAQKANRYKDNPEALKTIEKNEAITRHLLEQISF